MAQSSPALSDPPSGSLRTADLLGALSLAADLAVGLPVEHAVRSCYIGMHIADRLQLSRDEKAALYYSELLMDAGCTAWTSQMAAAIVGDEIVARRQFVFFSDARNPIDVLGWMREYLAAGTPPRTRVKRVVNFALHGRDFVREGFQNSCEVAGRFAGRLGMPAAVQDALLSVFEQWDGSGPHGTRADEIPITSRIVYATSFLEAFHHLGGRAAAVRLARKKRGRSFDPSVVDAFLAVSSNDTFWAGLEQESAWTTVLSMEPQSPYRYVAAEKLEDVALSFADFADLKSFYSAGHSRRTADLAEGMARRMRLADTEAMTIRLAALMHDLGLVTVSSFTLDKPAERRTEVERERLRLHPYHAERILAKVPALEPMAALVAAHHERMDGQGYYRGLAGSQIPLGARIIAVADHFDELTHETPDQPALEPAEALSRMREDAGRGLCPDALQALAQGLQGEGPAAVSTRGRRAQSWPAGLTDREVETLRLVARGLSRRQVAEQLVVSEHTVRHHLEHIYNKAGVSTRVAATLFAVEHDLVG